MVETRTTNIKDGVVLSKYEYYAIEKALKTIKTESGKDAYDWLKMAKALTRCSKKDYHSIIPTYERIVLEFADIIEDMPVTELYFGNRIYHALKRAGINTVADFIKYYVTGMAYDCDHIKIRGFGFASYHDTLLFLVNEITRKTGYKEA